ncbi:hypothetical protein D3C85_1523880 [compost metagenome]
MFISKSNSLPVASSTKALMPWKAAAFRSTTGSKRNLSRIGLPSSVESRSVNSARLIDTP